MEFRIFFPLPQLRDSAWLSVGAIESYRRTLQHLAHFARAPTEARADSYFVTYPFLGLKYRHGSKLELKVREPIFRKGIERWTKTNLGRDEAIHYRDQIVKILQQHGHGSTFNDLNFDEQIEIRKARKNVLLSNYAALEVCDIEAPSSQPQYSGEILRREWFSLAIEGDPTEIREVLKSSSHSLQLKQSLRAVHELLRGNMEQAIAEQFVPIVSGYPMFVRCIAGKASAEEVRRDVVQVWEALMADLDGDP
jgi:hypothetical protein